jgi:hypothetical protein
MPFDKPTRNALAKMVGECRRLLTEDIRKQLQGVYGLQPDGSALPIERLGHLNERGRETAEELREWQEHLAANELGSDAKRRALAFERIAHETAFTVLNRLAALRLCEERGHVIECVRRGVESDGFQLFERLSGGALGTRGETYRIFLERMFDELAVDLGVLFDLRAPQSLVFPSEQTLEHVLELLNDPALGHLWTEDETIGWIYQYFNSEEERDAMRASQAPRNSRELAVRNQFFTPRYVVEFLTDNTLGRIWYEMRKGDTRLKDRCRYLVRRPTEIFLAPGEEVGGGQKAEGSSGQEVGSGQRAEGGSEVEGLNQEELLRQPVYIPHRPKKDPRDLKILDPAVGSAHFLLYGFDLLEVIYEEAWEEQYAVGRRLLAEGGGQNAEGRGQNADAGAELQGSDRVAEGDGPGGTRLSGDAKLSEGRAVRADFPGSPGGGVDPVQHCGRTGPLVDEGVRQFPLDRARVGAGGRDPGPDRRAAQVPPEGPAGRAARVRCGSWEVDQRAYERTLKEIGYDYSNSAFCPLPTAYSTLEELRKQIPALILRHNLHGIDIDQRACQIAALALWLRAQRTYQRLGLKAGERPVIKKSNIVCAEPMPGEDDLLAEFCAQLRPPLLGQLVRTIFERMKLAGEAGSLLNIEDDLRGAIAAAKCEWLKRPKEEQLALFAEPERSKAEQLSLFDLSGISDEQFWQDAEARVLDEMRRYAAHVSNGTSYLRRLFAEDAVRGFSFVDVCRKRYDLALMNPPFGSAPETSMGMLNSSLHPWSGNLAAAFVIWTAQRLALQGKAGVVADRTVTVKSSYEPFREFLLRFLTHIVDLGWNVLDANVEVTTFCFDGAGSPGHAYCLDLTASEQKGQDLAEAACGTSSAESKLAFTICPIRLFQRLPNKAIAYSFPPAIRRVFTTFSSLAASGHRALQGHNLSMEKFARLAWEVPLDELERGELVRMYKGGEFSLYYQPSYELALWKKDGKFLRSDRGTRWSNEPYQGKEGIGYGKRGDHLDAHVLPKGHIFTVEGLAVFPKEKSFLWPLLGILNSKVCSLLLSYYSQQHKEAGYVGQLPLPDLSKNRDLVEDIGTIAQQCFWLKHAIDRYNELSTEFICPVATAMPGSSSDTLFADVSEYVLATKLQILNDTARLDPLVARLYDLSLDDLRKLEFLAPEFCAGNARFELKTIGLPLRGLADL